MTERVPSYNERLFNRKTIRGKLHFARYIWLQKKIKQYDQNPKSVLELGCYDAKTIDFLPDNIEQYDGYDANWEHGLDLAKTKYKDSRFSFFQSTGVNDFNPNNAIYDISICMETIEHLAFNELEMFIKKLELSTNNYCFVTVPNEKGIVLIIKYLIKKLVFKRVPEEYSYRELFFAFIGRLDKVKRNEFQHKGFDYEKLVDILKNKFSIVEINGIPLKWLPHNLSFTVGIILKPKFKDADFIKEL